MSGRRLATIQSEEAALGHLYGHLRAQRRLGKRPRVTSRSMPPSRGRLHSKPTGIALGELPPHPRVQGIRLGTLLSEMVAVAYRFLDREPNRGTRALVQHRSDQRKLAVVSVCIEVRKANTAPSRTGEMTSGRFVFKRQQRSGGNVRLE
jgi:hypothetical protein